MRLLATADLHYNHPRSRPLAADVIGRMNRAGGDVVLVIGDTAVADGDALEQCLSLFTSAGPKLFLCGNHELWTRGPDSYRAFTEDLPARVLALGWHWLEGGAWARGGTAIVGTVGWYDYAFASPALAIPDRFYAAKVSPAAAAYLGRDDLRPAADDVPASAATVMARWNDGKFVTLGRTDEAFLDECVARLDGQLKSVGERRHVVAATHVLPFAELLPPAHAARWEFTKAYLGSPRLGEVMLRYPNVQTALCGHSHFPVDARVGHVTGINVGSGYRWKTFRELDLPD